MNRYRHSLAIVLCAAWLVVAGCDPGGVPSVEDDESGRVEATSFLGEPLVAPALPDEYREKQELLLAEARAVLDAEPDSADALIWVGRRTAYLGRYGEALEVYSRGIEMHPDDARLYRHRGHRYITTRQLERAITDLEHAATLVVDLPDAIEPDGLPNALGIPTSTLNSNIWYHLGLAHFLSGDLESAERAYRECIDYSGNPDMLSATTHWLYMTLRGLGREADAAELLEPIHAEMEIIENRDYHRLLMMYRGEIDPGVVLADVSGDPGSLGFASTAYGVATWYGCNRDHERAVQILEQILAGKQWAAFGFIAAEADMARLRSR